MINSVSFLPGDSARVVCSHYSTHRSSVEKVHYAPLDDRGPAFAADGVRLWNVSNEMFEKQLDFGVDAHSIDIASNRRYYWNMLSH